MSAQKIKFVTGFGSFGGSTIAIIEHSRLLSENGFDVEMFAPGDWHMGRFHGCRPLGELSIDREDIVVFHHFSPEVRPRCKKSILYVHEKNLWNLRSRDLLPFDSIAYVSEDQAAFHGKPGFIVPNPVGRLVDISAHNPPRANIAGIVGTIQSRKMQHLSVKKALEDGMDKVLLFGDFEDGYFNSEIRPMLSERVIYMGLVEPEERMGMYNMFDVLYMLSSEEAASLVLGECRILGKEVVKSDHVVDYEILSDEGVIQRWIDVFRGESHVMEKHMMISCEKKVERLVCVVTHNRKETVGRWLRAWNNSDKFGAKLAVLHACDGQYPDPDEMNNILAYTPDFYVPFRNGDLRDMLALHLVIRDAAGLPEWDNLFWFTDDMIPMRKDFLSPFIRKLVDPVGLVAHCYEPMHSNYKEEPGSGCLPHIRTVAYALTRDSSDKLVFPSVGAERDRPYLFEHGRVGLYTNHILRQITDAGYQFALCHSEEGKYVHWTESMDWMWDCHFFADGAVVSGRKMTPHEMWSLYESQFAHPGSFDPLVLFTPERCEKIHLSKGTISALIPTFSSPIDCFIKSVFSIVLRSNPSVLGHLFISINGPDSREGGNELQDMKQAFVEDLRSARWPGRGFNPGAITITRTWSRIGHSQAIDQCVPWVDTEFYLSMHDDVIVMNPSWCVLDDFYDNENMIMKTWGSCLSGRLRTTGSRLDMPHLNTIFTLCRKPMMTSLGVGWSGFSLNHPFRISDYTTAEAFEGSHKILGSIGFESSLKRDAYESISLDIGCFLFSRICLKGLDIGRFDPGVARHFGSSSWKPRSNSNIAEVDMLEEEIMSIPSYRDIYRRYVIDG